MEAPANDLYVFWHEFMIMNTPLFFEHCRGVSRSPRLAPRRAPRSPTWQALLERVGGARRQRTLACLWRKSKCLWVAHPVHWQPPHASRNPSLPHDHSRLTHGVAEKCVGLAQSHLTQAHLFDLFDEWSDFVFVQKKGRRRPSTISRCGTALCHLDSGGCCLRYAASGAASAIDRIARCLDMSTTHPTSHTQCYCSG